MLPSHLPHLGGSRILLVSKPNSLLNVFQTWIKHKIVNREETKGLIFSDGRGQVTLKMYFFFFWILRNIHYFSLKVTSLIQSIFFGYLEINMLFRFLKITQADSKYPWPLKVFWLLFTNMDSRFSVNMSNTLPGRDSI